MMNKAILLFHSFNPTDVLLELDDAVGGVIAFAEAEVGVDEAAGADEAAGVENGVAAGLGMVAQDGTKFGQPGVVVGAINGEDDSRPFACRLILFA